MESTPNGEKELSKFNVNIDDALLEQWLQQEVLETWLKKSFNDFCL